MKPLIKLNVVFFVFYFLLQFLGSLESFLVFRIARSLIELVTILVLGGLNITALILLFSKYDFDFWEILSLSSAISLLFVPLLLTIEFSQFHLLFSGLPAVNSFLIFLILATSCYFKRKDSTDRFQLAIDKLPTYTANALVSSPLFWVFILNVSVVFIIFSAYYALPDLDPFYWIQRSTKDFGEGVIARFTLDRPLFSSFIYILNQGAHIDLYATFKYVIPLLSLLTLIPAWFVARKFPTKLLQTLILLLPLSSSSTILYTQIAMPQAILIILTFYFFYFLIYSWFFEKKFFYYSAGLTIFLSYFYHEIAAVIFLVWLFVSIAWNWRNILQKALREKLLAFVTLLLLISNASLFTAPLDFTFFWFNKIISAIALLKTNFLFPLYYVNMNNQSMGWGDTFGVIKYYLYYPGIAILLFLFAFIFIFFRTKEIRMILHEARKNKEFVVLTLCFTLFFAISEILPRFFNVALLPERIWIYTGIFSLTFFFILTKINTKKVQLISIIALLGIATNIGGAIYINSLKKYMISNDELSSAEWIRNNLPNNRVIFTGVEKNLLRYYSKSKIQTVSADFYYDIDTTLAEINKFETNQENLVNNYSLFIETYKENLDELDSKNPSRDKESILTFLDENIRKSTALVSLLRLGKIDSEEQPLLYIYYSKPNVNDPYIDRPYYAGAIKGTRKLIIDQYPDKFQRVYEDTANNIIIWKIL